MWKNPTPSSMSFCRPIKFIFCKETPEVIRTEIERINEEISSLIPTVTDSTEISHQLVMTMVDGKICNLLSETRFAVRCYICGATPKCMNNLKQTDGNSCNEKHYKFGLFPLHAKLRFFESLLHLSHNLDFKKWSASKPEYKKLHADTKLLVEETFHSELGLIVDWVKQGGGTFNDGNTARRFFKNPKITAQITGVNENIIHRFSIILQVISSGQKINIKKFGRYAYETAELFVALYSWYYMPVTVHKILIHGEKIIEEAIVVPLDNYQRKLRKLVIKNLENSGNTSQGNAIDDPRMKISCTIYFIYIHWSIYFISPTSIS